MTERIITGMRRRTGPIPAFSIGIASLFAVSIERKYVTENRKEIDATIRRYCGSERRM